MDRKSPSSQLLSGVSHCEELLLQIEENTATGAFLAGSSEVFRDYLDLQCDFQYKAKPVYPKQKGERRSRTALLKTSLASQEERGGTFKRKKSLRKKTLVTLGNLWISLLVGFGGGHKKTHEHTDRFPPVAKCPWRFLIYRWFQLPGVL